MKISSNKIREKLINIWPDLEYNCILMDNTFWMPSVSVIDPLLKSSNVPKMEVVPLFNDCDNFALQFQAEVRRKRYLAWTAGNIAEDQVYPISIGIVLGDMFRGISKSHAANLMICQEGIYIIDTMPDENRYWEVTKENDNIRFILM